MKVGDSLSFTENILIINGKEVGKVTAYDETTATLTWIKFSFRQKVIRFAKRLWRRLIGG